MDQKIFYKPGNYFRTAVNTVVTKFYTDVTGTLNHCKTGSYKTGPSMNERLISC